MKKMFIIIVALIISFLIPVHSAFAYGGGGGGGDDDASTTGLRDANEPPKGFTASEIGVDPTKNIKAVGKITLTPASHKTSNYEVDEAALQNGDTIVAGKNGATITWPNGAVMRLKPNTQIQIIQNLKLPHADAVRVFYGGTTIKLNYNERNKKFQAITPQALGAPGG